MEEKEYESIKEEKKEIDSNRDDYLLLDKNNSEGSINRTNKSSVIDEFDKYIKVSTPEEKDIQSLIQKFEELPCCINKLLERIMKNQYEIFVFLEIRKRNIKIKIKNDPSYGMDAICQWCQIHCSQYNNFLSFTETEINITETNRKICSCGLKNHENMFDEIIQKNNFKFNSKEQNEIDKIINLCNNYTIKEREKLIKEETMNLIKKKDNDKILQIICNMLNINSFDYFFYNLDYNDDIYSKIFSCIKESKKYSSYGIILSKYISKFFFDKISDKEIPIYSFFFNENNPFLYYYNPDIFSHSFFFQVYGKRIISKYFESNDCISFLRKIGISNEIMCSFMIPNGYPMDLIKYGFFTLDSISNLNEKELMNFKTYLKESFIYIFINQLCEIFSDFILNGYTNRISLLNKSNHLSKILIQFAFDRIIDLYMPCYPTIKELNYIFVYPLFEFFFYDKNKQRIINLLSSYSLSLAHKQNIFEDSKDYTQIFNLIELEVKKIINEKKLRKNDSQQNIFIVKKLLDLYQLKYENIEELYLYDFNNLLQNIIEKDYPIKIVNEALELSTIYKYVLEKRKSLDIYLEYIKKIILLCNINILGGAYIYNSNFIPKIIRIIQNLNFSDYPDFIIEILIILKKCFNRKIIDISFFTINEQKVDITVKEYLIDILFKNEPIIVNESMYDFNIFNNLLDRINTIYSFVFEKKNINILPDSLININFEESYLNIIKTISLNMNEEFAQMNWKKETNNLMLHDLVEDKVFIQENEKYLEKKIKEEISKTKTKISGFILLDLLRCLENLNQTNFYLKYENKSYLIDDKYDLTSIIINDNLPLAVKSILLNFLLKLILTQKIDATSNKIYGPLVYKSCFEKVAHKIFIKGSYFITLKSNESEKHLNETVKLINFLIICIELLKKKAKSLNFEKAFIEKNGLYDYCVSIIKAIHSLSNLIVNTNNIYDLYLSCFSKLAFKFFEAEFIFMKIININIDHKKIIFDLDKEFDYKENMSIIAEVNIIIEKYIDKINSDLYVFSDRESTSIYQRFIDYNKGKLSTTTNNHYSFIFEKKDNEKITLEELNEFNGIDSNINSKILNNYYKWKQYIEKESFKLKNLIEKTLNSVEEIISKREMFYGYIFLHLADYSSYILNDHLFIKALIRIIRFDEQYKSVCDKNIKKFLEKYLENKDYDFNEFRARIIGQIIRKIYFLANYELLISQCFSNTNQEIELSDLLNSLILLLEILGENFNEFFHDSIFKYKFNISANNIPVAKYDEESGSFKMLKNNIEEKDIYSPFEILLELHQKIFESLKITGEDKYRETQQNNLLIIFNSLTYCIIEYTNFENPDYKPILEKLYLQYFSKQKKDKSLNSIFQSLNSEIDNNMLKKTKYIFIINNILSLFIAYIKYGKKEKYENYFNLHNIIYKPTLYLFNVLIYTLQIINYLDKNIIKNQNCEKILDLYKKEKFKDIQLFSIATKYYEILFILKKYCGYTELNGILPEYKEKQVNSKKIIDNFLDNFYSFKDIIVNDDSLDYSEKLSIFIEYTKSIDIIFSFWRQIFNDIEICMEDKKKDIYYIIRPENLYLSEYQVIFYDDIIDYSSRDSKLMGVLENIDSFIFEMITNFNNERFNVAKEFNYYRLEFVNILFFIIHNIILLIHYYKSWKEDYSKYNIVENYKSSKILLILSGVHILFIIIIIINWLINRLNIDYYHGLSKYSNKYIKSKLNLNFERKAFKLRKLSNNYLSSFSTISEFFPELTKKERIYILIVYIILLNPNVFPFIISLICLILYYSLSEIFLIAPLLLIANLIPTLSSIFKGLFNKFKYLIFIYSYTLIALYIFSWIGFLFLPYLFKFEVVNKHNENIVDQNEEIIEEHMCSSSIQCILYFLNFGLSSGGSLDLNLISFKNNYGYYLRQFFFDMFFFLFINMIFSNIFLALITDAFSEMRELAWKKENDKANVCFICGLTKSDCINQNIEFNKHIQEHSKWKYINFITKIILEEDVEFDNEQYYIWNLLKKKSIDWLPNNEKSL